MARRGKFLKCREPKTAVTIDEPKTAVTIDEPKTAVPASPHIFHCCKRCARKRQKRCLPQDLAFNILLQLSALVIHDVMKNVCGEWNLMIRSPIFIRQHLQNSTGGFIIQQFCSAHNAFYVEMRRGCLQLCKFYWGNEHLIHTSCNGLTLIRDSEDLYSLNVINPLTKQRTLLPRFFRFIGFHSEFKLAFAEASMVYKVVNAFSHKQCDLPERIAVLTVGVDRVWRHIDVQHLPSTTRRVFMTFPLVTGGYIHWIGEAFVLTLNVETETFCEFPMPRLRKRFGNFQPMGNNLSVVYGSCLFLRDVWEMNSETGEWTKLLSFDLKPLHYIFKGFFSKYAKIIVPMGWLVVREVLVLTTSYDQRLCITYNVKTGEIQEFELDTDWSNTAAKAYNFVSHVNSLVCLEG